MAGDEIGGEVRAAVRVTVLVVVLATLAIVVNQVEAGGSVSATRAAPGGAGPAGSSGPILLTNASSGSTVSASVGRSIVVRLTDARLHWSRVQVASSSGAPGGVLELQSETAAVGSSTTRLRVLNEGTASLTATGSPDCSTGAACPMFLLLWRVDIRVR